MKKTALYQLHIDSGAKMVPFAGWEMPLYYGKGATEEHRLVRRSAGLFDVSHMGTFRISGKGSEAFLDRMITSSVTKLKPGTAGYGLLLNEVGRTLDDVFLYRIEKDEWTLVVNASNLEKDLAWLQDHISEYECRLENISAGMSLLALQGPQAIGCLEKLTGTDLKDWERFSVRDFSLEGVSFRCGRTGYTGEDGVEIFADNADAPGLWKKLLDEGSRYCEIAPCGLAARDSLRFEPGFPLYGHELNETVLPPEALLKWACDFKSPFIGKEAVESLLAKGLSRKLVTFKLVDKGVPREGYEILSEEGNVIGEVVSGLYAPTVDLYCGNGFVPPEFTRVGTKIGISVRGRVKAAEVVKRPLYKPSYR